MRKYVVSVFAAASLLAVAAPSEAQSTCGSGAKVASAIWDKVGA